MARIELRPKARFDLLSLSNYIAENGGEARAERYLRKFNDTVSYLAQHPLMGRARSELGEGIRGFPFDEYVIFYVPIEDGVDLVRVIHSKLDLGNAWFEYKAL